MDMKRSNSIRLWFTGTLAGASLVGCGSNSDEERTQLSAGQTYTNNHYVRGAGYYHAPYGAWFARPYNSFTPGQGYFHGGQWSSEPNVASLQASQPAPEAVRQAQQLHNKATPAGGIRRGGFGTSSRFSGS